MNTSDTLNLAADLIEQRGWTSPNDVDAAEMWGDKEGTPLCLEGGIAAATGERLSAMSHGQALASCPAYASVWAYLETDPRWGFRERLLAKGYARVYDWNDTQGRTAAEVVEVLRACAVIEASRERETAEVTSC